MQEGGHMIDKEKLIELCNCSFSISGLYSYHLPSFMIQKRTVRSKGELLNQRLYYIVDGETTFVLNNKRIVAKKGDIVYLPPDIQYVSTWENPEQGAGTAVHFNLLCNNIEINISNDLFIIFSDKDGYYLPFFKNLAETYNKNNICKDLKCRSILLEILYNLFKFHLGFSDFQSNEPIQKGISYIEKNYMSSIDVNELAQMCSMSPSSFRAKFKKETNMSPTKYKNYLLMKKAAEYLATGVFTVQEVALTLGINDPYYFTRLFKQYFNVSPKAYKNMKKTNGFSAKKGL